MGSCAGCMRVWQRVRAYATNPMKAPSVFFASALTVVWSHFEAPITVTPTSSLAPSDNLQTPMNLVMPLRFRQVAFRALLGEMLFESADEILAGLNNVGTVHFARFDVIQGNLCMFSIYDGDFNGYIRDFIGTIGEAFDGIMRFVKDPPRTPCGENVDEFIEWVRHHDALQLPSLATDVTPDFVALRRKILVLLHRNRNSQLGIYRGYPGYSVAQIRNNLGVGW